MGRDDGGVGEDLKEWGEGRFHSGWRGGPWQMSTRSKAHSVPYTEKRPPQSRSRRTGLCSSSTLQMVRSNQGIYLGKHGFKLWNVLAILEGGFKNVGRKTPWMKTMEMGIGVALDAILMFNQSPPAMT
eukprot:14693281-Ditylum_brightwellii.AAC.1